MKNILKNYMACLCTSYLLLLSACGGGSNESSTNSNEYIDFPGSVNGDFVVDANNNKVRFLKISRSMETFDKTTSEITLSGKNEIVLSGNSVIGKVQLVAGSGNSTVAGLVASNGNMLAIKSDATESSLIATNIKFGEPGSAGSGSNGSSSNLSESISSCKNITYPGDKSDVQTYAYDAIAQLDRCLYDATSDSKYLTDGNNQCKVLSGLIAATQSTFKPLYCKGSKLI